MPSDEPAHKQHGPTVAGKIVAALRARARTCVVANVHIGLGYTAVRLEDGSTGVALTFHRHAACGCSAFEGQLPLAGRSASDLLPRLLSGV